MLPEKLIVTPETGREDITVKLGEGVVFETKYNGSAHLTRWSVNPANPAGFYLRELGRFLEHLVNTNYRQEKAKAFPPGVLYGYSSEGAAERLALIAMLGEDPKLLQHEQIAELRFLRINTYHADFGMQPSPEEPTSNRGWSLEPWTPEKGELFVITNDPELAVPVAGLISCTSGLEVSTEQLLPALNDVYARL